MTVTEFTGQYGTAHRVPPAHYQADSPAGLDSWVITAPCWHPYWSQYSLSVVTLTDLPGVPAPVKHFPEATHELLVVTLNPEHGPYDARTITLTAGDLPFLTPVNIAQQFVATDDQARHLAQLCARAVVHGVLCPETADAPDRVRTYWRQTIRDTLNHDRDPHHGHLN